LYRVECVPWLASLYCRADSVLKEVACSAIVALYERLLKHSKAQAHLVVGVVVVCVLRLIAVAAALAVITAGQQTLRSHCLTVKNTEAVDQSVVELGVANAAN
jgi:hypothetical protein